MLDPSRCRTDAHRRVIDWQREHVRRLRGKNLVCFCQLDQPCHADVLLELANAPAEGK